MKIKKICILLGLVIFLFLPMNSFASVTTYPRTSNNLQIRSSISVTNKVKQELVKNSVSLSQMKDQPNKLKYILFRLKLLKLAFSIQNVF